MFETCFHRLRAHLTGQSTNLANPGAHLRRTTATTAWFHSTCGAAPRLRRPRLGAATGLPHTSGPHVRSATYPTHEDLDPGLPAPRIGSTRRRSDPGIVPARSPIAAHR